MNQKFLSIAVLAAIGVIIMSGCIGEKEPEPQIAPEPSITINEIIEKTNAAIDNTNTYEFEQEQKTTKPKCIKTDKIKSKVDRTNEKLSGTISDTTKITVMGIAEEVVTTTPIYVSNGVSYTDIDGFWIKADVDWIGEDILGAEKNLLTNAELFDSGKVEGENVWILKTDADASIFNEIFMAIGGDYIEEVIDNAENVKVKLWISKDTFLPIKEYRSVETKFRGDDIKIEITTKFYGYNEPANIEIPAESRTAIYAEDLLEPVPNPEQVGKVINAIDDVKSYELNIVKTITKMGGAETDDINIKADRENKKVMITNLFKIEGAPITEKTYAVGDKEYTIYAYEIEETDVGKSWSCIYSEWETQDVLKQLRDAIENTNVAVTEDNDSWIFVVNATKDIFINDFGELADVEGGLGTSKSELLKRELDLNAKNIVMKIWIAKDTFLPVKEELSVESMFKASRMTLHKEIVFQNYNEPVDIVLPGSAKSAECISIEIC